MNLPGNQVFFNYTAVFSALLIGDASPVYRMATDSDSIFEIITQQSCVATDTPGNGGDVPSGNHYDGLYCTIFDTQVGRYLTNGQTPVVNIFGNAQYPNILPKSHWLLQRSVLEIQLFNNTPYDIASTQLVFSGIKHMVQGE